MRFLCSNFDLYSFTLVKAMLHAIMLVGKRKNPGIQENLTPSQNLKIWKCICRIYIYMYYILLYSSFSSFQNILYKLLYSNSDHMSPCLVATHLCMLSHVTFFFWISYITFCQFFSIDPEKTVFTYTYTVYFMSCVDYRTYYNPWGPIVSLE